MSQANCLRQKHLEQQLQTAVSDLKHAVQLRRNGGTLQAGDVQRGLDKVIGCLAVRICNHVPGWWLAAWHPSLDDAKPHHACMLRTMQLAACCRRLAETPVPKEFTHTAQIVQTALALVASLAPVGGASQAVKPAAGALLWAAAAHA